MEKDVEVKIYDTPAKLSKKAARQIAAISQQEGTHPLHIALSGGSTPALLYEILAGKFRDKTHWERLHFWWGDERCVEPDSMESNFRMASERMLSQVPVNPLQIHRINGEAPLRKKPFATPAKWLPWSPTVRDSRSLTWSSWAWATTAMWPPSSPVNSTS